MRTSIRALFAVALLFCSSAFGQTADAINGKRLTAGSVPDSAIGGLNKPVVDASATVNVTLSGLQTLDGVSLTDGQTVLLVGQTTTSQNGPQVVHSGAWTRPTWYASGNTLQAQPGMVVHIKQGNSRGGATYKNTNTLGTTITIDTTATTWSLVPIVANSTTMSGIATVGFSGLASDLTGVGNCAQEPALTGDVTTSSGSCATSIAANAVTTGKVNGNAVDNTKLATMANGTIKCRTTAGTGNPEDCTGAQATALLSSMVGDSGSGGTKGLVAAPAAGDGAAQKFWRADGVWAAIAGATPVFPYGGDGSDGAATLDGSTNFNNFSSRSGSTYTLTRDAYLTTLTVNSGVTLKTAGFRVFASTSVTVQSTGIINNDGGNATTTTTGGAGAASGYLGGGTIGGTGGVNAGSAGTNNNSSTSSNTLGSAGGGGGAGASAGGTGGTATAPAANVGGFRNPPRIIEGYGPGSTGTSIGAFNGGAGAGGGGGDATNRGGAGGGGGGVVIISSPTITNSGTISAKGGNGFTPTVGTNCGGGGGGGGGALFLIYHSLTNTGTLSVAGGTHGNGLGTGAVGTDGTTGLLVSYGI